MYGCESWTVKKAEHRKIDAFKLWCWRRLLRVPWTARRSNQSILKEINPGCSLEGLMLKLKHQYFGHVMRRVDWLEKTLMLGGIGGRRIRDKQRMRWLNGITDSWTCVWVDSGSLWWTGRPGVLWFMGSQRGGHNWATELNWIAFLMVVSLLISEYLSGLLAGSPVTNTMLVLVPSALLSQCNLKLYVGLNLLFTFTVNVTDRQWYE